MNCNGSKRFTNEVVTLDGYGDVWIFQECIAYIISLTIVYERYPVILEEGKFTISRGDGIYTFQEQENGCSIPNDQEWKRGKEMAMVNILYDLRYYWLARF